MIATNGRELVPGLDVRSTWRNDEEEVHDTSRSKSPAARPSITA